MIPCACWSASIAMQCTLDPVEALSQKMKWRAIDLVTGQVNLLSEPLFTLMQNEAMKL